MWKSHFSLVVRPSMTVSFTLLLLLSCSGSPSLEPRFEISSGGPCLEQLVCSLRNTPGKLQLSQLIVRDGQVHGLCRPADPGRACLG